MQNRGLYIVVIVIMCVLILLTSSGCGLFIKNIPPGEILNRTSNDKFITVKTGGEDVNFHYLEFPGAGKDVVLLHGFASSTFTWKKLLPYLKKNDYHVLALDMKGFGWSDKPGKAKYDPITLMKEVKNWMDVMNLKDVTFAGNSLGGSIGFLMAIEYPEMIERLVLIDAGGYHVRENKFFQLSFSSFLVKMFFSREKTKKIYGRFFYNKNRITDNMVDAYYNRLRAEGALDAQMAFTKSLSTFEAEKYVKRLPEIKQKTLIVWGRDDKWIPLEFGYKFRRAIPNSTLVVIPECGHVPQEEYPEKTAGLIVDFIEGNPIQESSVPEGAN